jgi:protoporphyrinogen/coproporphyrinogen III oxidase
MASLRFHLVFTIVAGACAVACSASDSEHVVSSGSQLALELPSKSLRIAVVGAGPSGLTAADTLNGLGYQNVTVFEQNNRVGGKVYSVPNPSGSGVVELGAVFATTNYTTVLGYASKYNIPYTPFTEAQSIIEANGTSVTAQEFLENNYDTWQILGALAAYTPLTVEMDTILNEDGFDFVPPIPPDYYLPFAEFAAKKGLTPITEMVRAVLVGFGYGYYENTPAIYYLKLIGWVLQLNASITQPLTQVGAYTFPGGFQSIWTALASDLQSRGTNIELNSTVTSIVRPSPDGANVQITINNAQAFDFDDVIISAPLNRVGNFTSLTSTESSLFSQVQTERYAVTVFNATGVPSNNVDYFYGNASPAGLNHLVALGNPASGSPLTAYQIADQTTPVDQLETFLASDVAAVGGQVTPAGDPDAWALIHQEWDYFPTVGTAAAQNGFFVKMAALQGQNHTFYVGSTLSFEDVERSARFAKSLVETSFLPAVLP